MPQLLLPYNQLFLLTYCLLSNILSIDCMSSAEAHELSIKLNAADIQCRFRDITV